jgi:DNA-directed RNA polymerase subunit M/transcription elongation factor TFIIS
MDCKQEFCTDPLCDGIYCPNSTKMNLSNVHEHFTRAINDLSARALKSIKMGQIPKEKLNKDFIQGMIMKDLLKLSEIYEMLENPSKQVASPSKRIEDYVTSAENLKENSKTTCYTCCTCTNYYDLSESHYVSSCGHHVCPICSESLGITDNYIMDCMECQKLDAVYSIFPNSIEEMTKILDARSKDDVETSNNNNNSKPKSLNPSVRFPHSKYLSDDESYAQCFIQFPNSTDGKRRRISNIQCSVPDCTEFIDTDEQGALFDCGKHYFCNKCIELVIERGNICFECGEKETYRTEISLKDEEENLDYDLGQTKEEGVKT